MDVTARTLCSADEFKAAMRRLAASVCVLTTVHEGRRFGLTATAVCSLCADPPSVIVCINRRAEAYAAMVGSGRVGINILAEDQSDIALRFTGMSGHRGEDKFTDGEWVRTEDGAPVLSSAPIALDCVVDNAMDYGSHTVLFCNISRAYVHGDHAPLIYMDHDFLTVRPLDVAAPAS